MSPGLLSYLDSEDRILATNISNGFAPGEAASFLLLSKNYDKSFLPVTLSAPGVSKEEGHYYADEVPYRGDGLAEAFRRSISNSRKEKIKRIYSSMNGENFFVKEFGVALIRNSKRIASEHSVEHPADCYGDLGAATGAVLTTLAAIELSKERSNEYDYLVCCS
jgi:3-oxoacyl-[acyl-carrier-protein] synthase-1